MAETHVKHYRGRDQAAAVAAFSGEANVIARDGWVPVGQVWVAGSRSLAGIILIGLGMPVLLLGLLALVLAPLAGLVLVVTGAVLVAIGNTGRRPGALAVTYSRP